MMMSAIFYVFIVVIATEIIGYTSSLRNYSTHDGHSEGYRTTFPGSLGIKTQDCLSITGIYMTEDGSNGEYQTTNPIFSGPSTVGTHSSNNDSSTDITGIIVGVFVGLLLVAAICSVCIYLLWRRRHQKPDPNNAVGATSEIELQGESHTSQHSAEYDYAYIRNNTEMTGMLESEYELENHSRGVLYKSDDRFYGATESLEEYGTVWDSRPDTASSGLKVNSLKKDDGGSIIPTEYDQLGIARKTVVDQGGNIYSTTLTDENDYVANSNVTSSTFDEDYGHIST